MTCVDKTPRFLSPEFVFVRFQGITRACRFLCIISSLAISAVSRYSITMLLSTQHTIFLVPLPVDLYFIVPYLLSNTRRIPKAGRERKPPEIQAGILYYRYSATQSRDVFVREPLYIFLSCLHLMFFITITLFVRFLSWPTTRMEK